MLNKGNKKRRNSCVERIEKSQNNKVKTVYHVA